MVRIWSKAGSADEPIDGPRPRRGDWSRRAETDRVLGREGVARITRRSIDRILALARRHGAEVLFVGYQAGGTRGRKLVDGAPTVKIHGQVIPVKARIAKIDSMSAHADQSEMMRWLRTLPEAPKQLFLVHGEPGPMDALKARIEKELGWSAVTPSHGDTVNLG